jgi:hypothetical protein
MRLQNQHIKMAINQLVHCGGDLTQRLLGYRRDGPPSVDF